MDTTGIPKPHFSVSTKCRFHLGFSLGARKAYAFRLSNDGAVFGLTFQGGVAVYSTQTFEELGVAETGIKGIYGVAFSPDASLIAATSADGKVRIWEVPG